MSDAGLGLREELLYKGTFRAMDLRHQPSPLHLQQLKSQHHENLSSTSTTPALSVSCTRTLLELPPPSPLTSLIMFLGFGVLVSRGHLAVSPFLFTYVFATSLSACTVGNTLSPMLQTAGTTVRSRRNLFNRPLLISSFSSSPLETA